MRFFSLPAIWWFLQNQVIERRQWQRRFFGLCGGDTGFFVCDWNWTGSSYERCSKSLLVSLKTWRIELEIVSTVLISCDCGCVGTIYWHSCIGPQFPNIAAHCKCATGLNYRKSSPIKIYQLSLDGPPSLKVEAHDIVAMGPVILENKAGIYLLSQSQRASCSKSLDPQHSLDGPWFPIVEACCKCPMGLKLWNSSPFSIYQGSLDQPWSPKFEAPDIVTTRPRISEIEARVYLLSQSQRAPISKSLGPQHSCATGPIFWRSKSVASLPINYGCAHTSAIDDDQRTKEENDSTRTIRNEQAGEILFMALLTKIEAMRARWWVKNEWPGCFFFFSLL